MLLLAQARANQGRLPQALAWIDRAILANVLDTRAHHIRATILQELGRQDEAVAAWQRAVYLEPDFIMAHLALAQQWRPGRPALRKHREVALKLLRSLPAGALVPHAEGLTAGRLIEVLERNTKTACGGESGPEGRSKHEGPGQRSLYAADVRRQEPERRQFCAAITQSGQQAQFNSESFHLLMRDTSRLYARAGIDLPQKPQ